MTKDQIEKKTRMSGRDMGEGRNDWLQFQIGRYFSRGTPFETFELVAFGHSYAEAFDMFEKKYGSPK